MVARHTFKKPERSGFPRRAGPHHASPIVVVVVRFIRPYSLWVVMVAPAPPVDSAATGRETKRPPPRDKRQP